jgi:hypothetical protein
MTKRRFICLCLAFVVLASCAIIYFGNVSRCPVGARFHEIHQGMTQSEVYRILGEATCLIPVQHRGSHIYCHLWDGTRYKAMVIFDDMYRVEHMQMNPIHEAKSFWQRVRDWF